jgi:methyltransferase (TIGR00027 family)
MSLLFSAERGVTVSAIEAGTAMLLETEFSWGPLAISLGIGAVFAIATILGIAMAVALHAAPAMEIPALLTMAGTAGMSAILLFDFGKLGAMQILLADGAIYPCAYIASGIIDGLATRATIHGTWYSMETYLALKVVAACGTRVIGPPLARALIDVGGRNTYAAVQASVGLLGFMSACKLAFVTGRQRNAAGDHPDRASVVATAAGVALLRDCEKELFVDPYAKKLAGDVTLKQIWPKRNAAQLLESQHWISLRTRWIDDVIAEQVAVGVRQLILVGAGFDCRALRVEALRILDMTVYEMDVPEVIEAKEARLSVCKVPTGSSCRCIRIATDLSLGDECWSAALLESGFDDAKSSIWLLEGIVAYLTEPQIDNLLHGIGQLTQTAAANHLTPAPSIVVTWPGSNRRLVNECHRFASDFPEDKLFEHGLGSLTSLVSCEGVGQVAQRLGRGEWFAPEDRSLLLTHSYIPAR